MYIRQRPHTRHTGFIITRELDNGNRLVGLPWKDDVHRDELVNYYVIDYGKQFIVSTHENSDIADLVANPPLEIAHLVRGLVFGYDPEIVLEYSDDKADKRRWQDYLHKMGVILSTDYQSGGYASLPPDAIVEPCDIRTLNKVIRELGDPTKITRWCPECVNYVVVSGMSKGDEEVDCPHKPITNSSLPPNKRHWYIFQFDHRRYLQHNRQSNL